MAIKIDFFADVAKFLRGTRNVSEALDEVADDLDDLGTDSKRTADKAGDALGDAFKDGSKDAGRSLESVGTDLKETGSDADRLEARVAAAFRGMAQDAKSSGKQVGDSQKKGFREAAAGAETFKEEADQNAREVAASFDGSAESIADGFQGLAAEMLSGFGPAGVVAGVAVAAGIGIAISKMQEGAEEATAMQEAVVEIAAAVAEAGGDIAQVDFAEIIRNWGREVKEDNWLTFWKDEATTNFQEAADAAEAAGVATRDAIRGMKGSADDAQGFLDGTSEEWERLGEVISEGTTITARGNLVMSDAAREAQKQRDALGTLRDSAQENLNTQREAIDVYNIEADALGSTADQAERAAEAVRDKADAARESANAAMGAVGADIDWRQALGELSQEIAANGQNLDLNTAAGQANQQNLIDLAQKANALVAARVAEGGSTAQVTAQAQQLRNEYIAQAIQAGHTAESAAVLADSYGLIPGNVTTLVQAQGTEEAKAAVDAAATDQETTVAVTEEGAAQAQNAIDSIDGTEVEAEVDAKGVPQAQREINAIKGKDVTVNIRLGNLAEIQRTLDALSNPRSVTLTINERRGKAVAP